MASNGNGKSGLLTAGGVLSIMAGISQIISGVSLAVDAQIRSSYYDTITELLFLPFLPGGWRSGILSIRDQAIYREYRSDVLSYGVPIQWVIIGGFVGVLGILAIVGGISAIRSKKFGLSLAGAICAIPSCFLGIPAVVFVALVKREFGAERKESASNGNSRGKLLTAGGILSIVAGIFQRGKLLTAGGILSIVAGIFQISNGGVLMAIFLTGGNRYVGLWPFRFLLLLPGRFIYDGYVWQIILGGSFVVLGILAVVGGISAIRRKKFGLSLAGAICALPSCFLGIPAVVFVALGKRKFGAERKESASNGNSRGKLLNAGGVLSIVAGIYQISSVVPIAVKSLVYSWPYGPSGLWNEARYWFLPFFPHEWRMNILWLLFPSNLTWGFILVGFVGVLGILAVVGGISATRRKRFGLSLAGAICAIPSWIFGILAVIFIALGKREFGTERKENGI